MRSQGAPRERRRQPARTHITVGLPHRADVAVWVHAGHIGAGKSTFRLGQHPSTKPKPKP